MANDSTRASGPDATGDDARPGKEMSTFEKAALLIRGSLFEPRERDHSGGIDRDTFYKPIDHGTLRILLMNLVGVPADSQPAFDSRLKHTIRQGVASGTRTAGGGKRGGHRRFPLSDVLQLALAIQLQRALVDPAAAAAFIVENRDELERQWLIASRAIEECWLEIEVDAYAVIGDSGKGRPSGRVGALAFPGTRPRRGIAEPALTLRVDLLGLYDRVTSSMMILGDAIREARRRFPGMDHAAALEQHLKDLGT